MGGKCTAVNFKKSFHKSNTFSGKMSISNKLNTEKDIYSIENKSQPINISSNNNEFNTIKPKENNNNKIKNIKTQSYKTQIK